VVSHAEGSQPVPATLIVVEPDVLARTAIADYLRKCGYLILETANAEETLQLLAEGKKTIDVVFSEVALPGPMDGFSLARRIRDEWPGVDVLLTSGIANAAMKAGELCDDGPISKPYEPSQVIKQIELLREKNRQLRKP